MRENKKLSKWGIYAIIVALLVIGVSLISLFAIGKNKKTQSQSKELADIVNEIEETNSVEEASSTSDKTVNEVKDNKIALNTENLVTSENTNTITKQTNTIKKNNNTTETKKTTEKKKEIKFEKPVEGEIIKEYAKDNLVYSNTLNEWTTHLGIDIKAEKTTVVKSSCEGTVESIKNDPRYGLTVIIKHDDGYKTVYSNLLTAEFVVEGEKVTTGQTIGTVGNTATFEVADESHLHFEILKDNVQVDPTIYVNY